MAASGPLPPVEPGQPGAAIEPGTLDRRWRLWASVAVGGFVAVGAVLGFLVLPNFQRSNAGLDLWNAICRAVGITEGSPAYRQSVSTATALPVSQVAWDPDVLDILANAHPQQGAQLAAQVCVSCHGENGASVTAEIPSLAGQSSAAIYKQLHDYRSGARVDPQMLPVAAQLTVPQLASVSVYYGRFAEERTGLGGRYQSGDIDIVKLAREGDSARALPACDSCHVTGSGGPIESPVLTGQHHDYLAAQLRLFKTGARQNDVYRRMREIAEQLSDEEIEALATYYQGVL
jgi:cytochrome c553